ncbi:heat shock protein HslJ [Pseudescherichia vulneris]|uniref:heat shock protein HslJ n=1 Tax=Pseudescherichia vulneris TaxID=566 RepID=UPI0012ABB7AF|nr:heat shock protein HslJ [Pseudescherichia vulneris]MDU5454178.1 heat shock protein HslJ [Pseudescherichia vulneris]
MKRVIALTGLCVLLAGCVRDGKVSVTSDQLIGHRFVLENVNGKAITPGENPPELRFGEKMAISGSMCNRFSGKGKLSSGELTAKELVMTRMACIDPQRSELDSVIGTVLKDGAQVDLTDSQLTLTTADKTLIYKLADAGQ